MSSKSSDQKRFIRKEHWMNMATTLDQRFSWQWLWRVLSSGLEHCVIQEKPNVLKKHIASILSLPHASACFLLTLQPWRLGQYVPLKYLALSVSCLVSVVVFWYTFPTSCYLLVYGLFNHNPYQLPVVGMLYMDMVTFFLVVTSFITKI
jgi:hypothetical protein